MAKQYTDNWISDDDIDFGPDPEEMDFAKVKSSYLGVDDFTGSLPDVKVVTEGARAKKEMEERDRILDVVHTILYVFCFFGAIASLVFYGNYAFEETGPFFARLSLCFLVGAFWVTQRVRLFRIPALILTILYAPYAWFYIQFDVTSVASAMVVASELVFRWMLFQLILDIALAGKNRRNEKFTGWRFALLCIVSFLTLLNRNGNMAPIAYFCFIIACFIPAEQKDWERVIRGLVIAQIIAFVGVTVMTFLGNPFSTEPGAAFMTNEHLGLFYGLCLVICTYEMVHSAEKYGRVSVSYVFSAAWLIAIVVMIINKATFGLIPGAILMAAVLVIFGPGKKKIGAVLIRAGIVAAVLGVIVLGLFIFSSKVMSPNFDTDAFATALNNSPLQIFPDTLNFIQETIQDAHDGKGAVDGLFAPLTFGAFLNVLMGYRLEYFGIVAGFIDWNGHALLAVDPGATVLASRNQYLAYLFEYGIFAGALNIFFFVSMWVSAIVEFVKSRKERFLLPMLCIAMTLGLFLNSVSGVYYPLVMIAMLSMVPLWVDMRVGKRKRKEKAESEEEQKDEAESEGESETEKDKEAEKQSEAEKKSVTEKKAEEEKQPEAKEKTEAEKAEKKQAPKRVFKEEVGRPLDRSLLEDVEIIEITDFVGDRHRKGAKSNNSKTEGSKTDSGKTENSAKKTNN